MFALLARLGHEASLSSLARLVGRRLYGRTEARYSQCMNQRRIGPIALAVTLCGCAARSGTLPTSVTREPIGSTSAPEGSRVSILAPEASPITIERMSRWPEPGWQVPRSIAYSPDGKWVTFLESEKQNDETVLFGFDRQSRELKVLLRAEDLSAAKASMSREEELRRERERRKTKGITSYVWAKRSPVLVVPFGGDVFVRRADGAVTRLTETPDPEIDPKPCDSGERVAFVRKGELVSVDVATRKETVLTKGAPAGVTRGLSDFNGQEEFHEHSGFFWSPKCDRILYLEVDERPVAEIPILGFRNGAPDLMMQRYPVAGGKNPVVRLGVVDVANKRAAFVRLSEGEKYLGRFAWAPDGRAFFFETLSRDQKRLELVRVEAGTLAAKVIASETSPAWVEFSLIRPLERSARLLVSSNRTGYRHLELLDSATGARVAELTSGPWDLKTIEEVDEEKGRVFFSASKEGPLQEDLYSTKLSEPGEPARLTQEPGVHDAIVDPAGKGWVDLHSAIDRTPRAVVHEESGAAGDLPCPLDADFGALAIRSPELVTVKGAGGDTLHGALLRPRNVVPGKRYPAVVMVYGGPGVQVVQNRWAARLIWQHLADRGIVVFELDNRGTPSRGRAFERATYGKLGELELADQLAGLDWLESLPFVDRDRVGIYGHSYGGFMAGLAMLRAPTRFRVGIAGSPVVDFALYDSGYTERYMGTPASNPTGYAATDLTRLASHLEGKLLVLHALMDENVHFQNSARLVDALASAGKHFDLMVFPGERHGYQSTDARRYAAERVVDYFTKNL
jgi:dipeptidyl-peptidase-4